MLSNKVIQYIKGSFYINVQSLMAELTLFIQVRKIQAALFSLFFSRFLLQQCYKVISILWGHSFCWTITNTPFSPTYAVLVLKFLTVPEELKTNVVALQLEMEKGNCIFIHSQICLYQYIWRNLGKIDGVNLTYIIYTFKCKKSKLTLVLE